MTEFELSAHSLTQFSLTLPRLAAALMIAPLLAPDTVPQTARNVFIVGLGLALYPLLMGQLQGWQPTPISLAPLLLKEVFLGAAIGFTFSIIFWALASAGDIIDNKIGAVAAQASDPQSGQAGAIFGVTLARLGGYLFIALGGVRVFLELVMTSYEVWPIDAQWPDLNIDGSLFFVNRAGDLLRLALLFAAPTIAILALAELALGTVNRYAPQLNVFSISMAIKGMLSALILLLLIGTFTESLIEWIGQNQNLLEALKAPIPAQSIR